MRDKKDTRIAFWGAPEFAIPALSALFKNDYKIIAVITNPDKPAGRKQTPTPPPVKVFAQEHNIPVLQPENLANYKLQIANYKPDLFIVAAYGKIIPKEILEIPKFGALNIHPSLLPRWRAPAPIQYTILNGDTETGVTIILMDEKMDHGPIIANSKFKIQNSKITYWELHDRLAYLGAELLIETLPKWLCGKITPIPQDEAKATYSKILKKEDGKIDWQKSAREIERMIRAFASWPGSFTFWQRGKNRIRLEIENAEVSEEKGRSVAVAGSVWKSETGALLVQTGKGHLRILQIHPEGKKSMTAEEFLNGYGEIIGAVLDF